MIFDIMLLSYNGDHVLCDSKPLILYKDDSRVDYDEFSSEHYIGIIENENYHVKFLFDINREQSYYALVNTEIKISKKYIESIFKKF